MKTKFEQVFARYIPFFPLFSTGQLVDQSRESSRDRESGGKNQVVLPDLLVEGLWEKKKREMTKRPVVLPPEVVAP